MKNILLTFCFLLVAGLSYGQIKVIANGNVGMGVSNPTEKLQVDGNIDVYGNNMNVGTDAGAAEVTVNIGEGRSANGKATIDFVGDIANPDWGLRIQRLGSGNSRFTHQGTGSYQFLATGSTNIGFFTNNTLRMQVRGDGSLGVGTSSPSGLMQVNGDFYCTTLTETSDMRLKKNIKDFNGGLEIVLQMQPKTYEFNGEGGIKSKGSHIGILAQDLQQIAPYLITEYKYTQSDLNQKVLESGDYLGVKASDIKYLLVNAVQEQQNIIDSQKAEIDELNDKVSEMEAVLNELKSMIVDLSSTTTENVTLEGFTNFELGQNIPNPFNDVTSINYEIPSNYSNAQIRIVDESGRLLKVVPVSGAGTIQLDTENLASGKFHYSLVADGKIIETKTMVYTK